MRRTLITLAAAALLVSACTDDNKVTSTESNSGSTVAGSETTDPGTTDPGTTDPGTTDATTPTGDAFEWEEFDSDGVVQTGHLEVPIDYDDPAQGTFDLDVLVDVLTDLRLFIIGPVVHLLVRIDTRVLEDLECAAATDAIDVREAYAAPFGLG